MVRLPQQACRPAGLLALVVVAAAGCNTSLYPVKGRAMEPAFTDGERVFVSKTIDPLARGDVIVFRYPHDYNVTFIQRVIGLPGETIEIQDGRVRIDGRAIEEPYVAEANRSRDTLPARAIPAGEYFVMGDNRFNSSDSRTWGTVRRDIVLGKVTRR